MPPRRRRGGRGAGTGSRHVESSIPGPAPRAVRGADQEGPGVRLRRSRTGPVRNRAARPARSLACRRWTSGRPGLSTSLRHAAGARSRSRGSSLRSDFLCRSQIRGLPIERPRRASGRWGPGRDDWRLGDIYISPCFTLIVPAVETSSGVGAAGCAGTPLPGRCGRTRPCRRARPREQTRAPRRTASSARARIGPVRRSPAR